MLIFFLNELNTFYFTDITYMFSFAEDQVKKKWHQLRSNYMRVKRSEKNKPPGKAKTKWIYYDLMTFLDEFSESKDTSSNAQQESPHQPPSICDEHKYETGSNESMSEEDVPTENVSAANAERPKATNFTASNKKNFKRRKGTEVVDDDDFQYLPELR